MNGMLLSLDKLPTYILSSFRSFEAHERHMTRTCKYDVLVMVFDGVLRFYEDGIPVEVRAGEYYIQRQNMRHEGIEESDSPKYYYIHFHGLYSADGNTLPLHGKADFDMLFPLFRKMDALRLTGASAVETNAVFFHILSMLKQSGEHTDKSDIVRKVITFVAQDIRIRHSLETLADACGYSKNHMIKVFRKETGKTPHEYITDMKIEMAKQQLLNSESSLAQISIECGFGEYINFYKAFTRAEGCAPLDWKKKQTEM